jgi:hypothetical protein
MTWTDEKTHRAKVIAKLERIAGLEALLHEWEPRMHDSEQNYQYVLKLKERIRRARNEYNAFA